MASIRVDNNQRKLNFLFDGHLRREHKVALTAEIVVAIDKSHLVEMRLDCGIVVQAMVVGEADALHPMHAQHPMFYEFGIEWDLDTGKLAAIPRAKAEGRSARPLTGD